MTNFDERRRSALKSATALVAAGTLLASAAPASAAPALTNRALIDAFADALTAHDLERFKSLYAPDYIQHQTLVATASGLDARDAVVAYFGKRIQAFPDLVVTSNAAVTDGEFLSANFVYSGTHRGEYLGVQPTGKRVTFNSTDIMRVRDGQFVEHWGAADIAGLLQQLRSA